MGWQIKFEETRPPGNSETTTPVSNHFAYLADTEIEIEHNRTHRYSQIVSEGVQAIRCMSKENKTTNKTTDSQLQQREEVDVLIIGNSNSKGIVPHKMYKNKKCLVHTLDIGAKTIKGAIDYACFMPYK